MSPESRGTDRSARLRNQSSWCPPRTILSNALNDFPPDGVFDPVNRVLRRAPTSPPKRWPRGTAGVAGRSRTSPPTGPLRARAAAGTTEMKTGGFDCGVTPARRCETWSASPLKPHARSSLCIGLKTAGTAAELLNCGSMSAGHRRHRPAEVMRWPSMPPGLRAEDALLRRFTESRRRWPTLVR